MIRFKKQFLFLFSFPFKIQALLSQQAVSNINVSQQSFYSFFFFLSFFYLRKCLSHQAEGCNKVYSLIYCWWNRILFFSFFFFLNTYSSLVFSKGRRKNSLSCTYLWQGLIFRFLSFTSKWHPQSWQNWRLSFANVCPELNFFFQIFSNEKKNVVWSMGQSFGFFLLPQFHPVTIIEWPGFLSLSNQ